MWSVQRDNGAKGSASGEKPGATTTRWGIGMEDGETLGRGAFTSLYVRHAADLGLLLAAVPRLP